MVVQIFKNNLKKILYFYILLFIPLVIYLYLFLRYYYHGLKIYDSLNSSIWIMINDIVERAKEIGIGGFVEGVDKINGMSEDESKDISYLINLGLKKYKGWKIVDEGIRKDVVKKLNKYLSRYEIIDNKEYLTKVTLSERIPDYIFQCSYGGVSGQIMSAKITCSLVNSSTKEVVFDSYFIYTKPFFEWILRMFEGLVSFLSYFSLVIYTLTLVIVIFYFIFKQLRKFIFMKLLMIKFNKFLFEGDYKMCQDIIEKYVNKEGYDVTEMKNILEQITCSNIERAQKAFLDFINIKKIYNQTSFLNYDEQRRLNEIINEVRDERVINFYAEYVKKLKEDLENKKDVIKNYINNAEYVLAAKLIESLFLFFPSDAELVSFKQRLDHITKNDPLTAQNAYLTAKNIWDKIVYTNIVEPYDIQKLEEISNSIEHPDIMKFKSIIKHLFAGESVDIKKLPYLYNQSNQVDDSNSNSNKIEVIYEQVKNKKEEVIEKYDEFIKNARFKEAMEYIKDWKNIIPKLRNEYFSIQNSADVKRLMICKKESNKIFYLFRKNYIEIFKKCNRYPDIELNYEHISQDKHLFIEYKEGFFNVKDNNSISGFTHNGEKKDFLVIDDYENIMLGGIYRVFLKNIDGKILYFEAQDFNGFMIPYGSFKLELAINKNGLLVSDSNSPILTIASDGYGIGIKNVYEGLYKVISSSFHIVLEDGEYEIKIY